MKNDCTKVNLNRVDWLLAHNIQHRRPYASFFEWQNPNDRDLAKKVKERGVVRELVKSLEQAYGRALFKAICYGDDAPDIIGIQFDESKIGFEVTELVSQEAIIANSKAGKAIYFKKWTVSEVIARLGKALRSKSDKLERSPCRRNILVVHTDERDIRGRFGKYETALQEHSFEKPAHIDEAYLLFSYRPGKKTYPYLQLKLQ